MHRGCLTHLPIGMQPEVLNHLRVQLRLQMGAVFMHAWPQSPTTWDVSPTTLSSLCTQITGTAQHQVADMFILSTMVDVGDELSHGFMDQFHWGVI